MQTKCEYHTVDVDQARTFADFVREVRRRGRYYDVVPILLVPAVLVSVHYWLGEARLAYAFVYEDPTLTTAYVANFVHVDSMHLFVNLYVYLLVVPLAYVLSVVTNRRRHAIVVFLLTVLVFPVVLMAALLPFNHTGQIVGFSGLSMAFYGYASLIFVGYVIDLLTNAIHLDHAPLLYFAQIAVITLLLVPPSSTRTVLLGASVLMTSAYLLAAIRQLDPETSIVHEAYATSGGYLETTVFGSLVVGVVLVLGFVDPTGGEGSVNYLFHLFGFSSGSCARS